MRRPNRLRVLHHKKSSGLLAFDLALRQSRHFGVGLATNALSETGSAIESQVFYDWPVPGEALFYRCLERMKKDGAGDRSRTYDLRITNALYQATPSHNHQLQPFPKPS